MSQGRSAEAILISLLIVISAIAVPVGMSGTASANPPSEIPDSRTFNATDTVDVWERGIFTLRHDFSDAATSAPVDSGTFRVSIDNEQILNRNALGVRDADESISIRYETSRANTDVDLSDTRVDVIAARATGGGDPARTFTEAIDALTTENANENATFERLKNNVSLGSDGTIEFDHDPPSPGHYIYMVATPGGEGEGFDVTNPRGGPGGDISTESNVTILGVETVPFQRTSSSEPLDVTPPSSVVAGGNATFEIDASGPLSEADSGDVEHTVLFYNHSRVRGSDGVFDINTDRSDITRDFNISEDSRLDHSIAEVNGVASVEEGISVNGIDLSDGRVSRTLNLGAVVDFVAEDINGNPPRTNPIDPKITLNGSLNATTDADPSTQVTVETFENFSSGTYRYVYIGTLEDNASAFTTDTGEIDIAEGAVKTASSGTASFSGLGGPVSQVSFSGVSGSVSVAGISSPPSGVPDATNRVDLSNAAYLSIDAELQSGDSEATVNVSSPPSINDPSDAVVYRYNENQDTFTELTTRTVTRGGTEFIEFDTPGFSTFAVGEEADDGDGGTPTPTPTPGTPEPGVSVSPQSVSFGDVPATTGQQSETITIENTGEDTLVVDAALASGDVGQFSLTDDVGDIEPGESDSVTVQYAPSQAQSHDATIDLRTNAPSGTVSVAVSGTGTAAQLSISPQRIDFGVGDIDESETETIAVENTGSQPLEITRLSTFSDTTPFSLSGITAGDEIRPGESQTAEVTYNRLTRGVQSGTVTIETNATFNPDITIRVQGTTARPELSVSPSELNFGTVTRDDASTQFVAVSNTGIGALIDPSVSVSGPFVIPNTGLPAELSGGDSVSIPVQIDADASPGTANGDITVTADGGFEETIPVSATIETPELANTGNRDLNFGEVPVGSTISESIVITNTAETADLEVQLPQSSIDETEFSFATDSESLTIPPGTTETLNVRFSPTDAAVSTEQTVSLTTNADEDIQVDLSGTGIETDLTTSQSSVQITTGRNQSESVSVTVTNDGEQDIQALSTQIEGDATGQEQLTITNAPSAIPGDSSETFTIEFTPTGIGETTATVNVTGENQTTLINIQAVSDPPVTELTQDSFSIGFTGPDETTTRDIRIENRGPPGADVTIDLTRTTISDDQFSIATEDPTITIGGESTAEIPIQYTPDSDVSGEQTATIELPTNDPNQPILTPAVTATVLAGNATIAAPFDRELAFGAVPVGAQSSTQTVIVTNTGGDSISIESVETGDSFETGSISTETLAPGQRSIIEVIATPQASDIPNQASDIVTDELIVTTDAQQDTDPDPVALSVNATRPQASLSTESIEFAEIPVSSSASRTITISNTGAGVLQTDSPVITGTDTDAFSIISGDRQAQILPGEQTNITVAYAPQTEAGSQTAQITINTTDPTTEAVSTSLSGSSVDTAIQLSRGAIGFGDIPTAETATESLTIENSGSAATTISQTQLTGADAELFSIVSGPSNNQELTANESINISVRASPVVRGPINAQLEIETTDNTFTASLGATATSPGFEIGSQSVTFDRTRVGEDSTETLQLSNTGNVPLAVSEVSISGADAQFRTRNTPDVISPGSTESAQIEFAPGGFGPGIIENAVTAAQDGDEQSATLTIETNASTTGVDTALSGTGETPALTRSSPALQFGTVGVGSNTSREVTIRNDIAASASVTLDSPAILGSTAYTVTNANSVDGTTLQPGESTTVTVELAPQSSGSKTAVLNIATNDPRQSSQSIFLSNTGTFVNITIGSVTAEFRGIDTAGQQSLVQFNRDLSTNASLRGFQPNVTDTTRFVIETNGFPSGEASNTVEPIQSQGLEPLRVIDVSVTGDNTVRNIQFRFRASKAILNTLEVPSGNVSLFQYNEEIESYQPVSTTVVDESRTSFIYEATAEDLSSIAIAVTGAVTGPEDETIVVEGDNPATDTDDDGILEDINGDGEFNFDDVVALAFNTGTDPIQQNSDLFDINNDGVVNFDDVVALAFESPSRNPVVTGNRPATDIDNDGQLEDINGDGELNFDDVVALAFNIESDAVQQNTDQFDFDNDGNVDFDDVVELAFET